jgi:hypothetical protein
MQVKIRMGGIRRDDPPDPSYLDRLAARLAVEAGISRDLARARVMALAVSARPRGPNHGFEYRCR